MNKKIISLVLALVFTFTTIVTSVMAKTPQEYEDLEQNVHIIGTHEFGKSPNTRQIMAASKTNPDEETWYFYDSGKLRWFERVDDPSHKNGVFTDVFMEKVPDFTITHVSGEPITNANTIKVRPEFENSVTLEGDTLKVLEGSSANYIKSVITSTDGSKQTYTVDLMAKTLLVTPEPKDGSIVDEKTYTIEFVKGGGGDAELTEQQKVSIAYDAVRKGTYTDLPIIEETQELKTAAVQTKVDTLIVEAFKAKARAVSDVVATVTFDNDIYKVAIVCGDTEDSFDITNATFKLSSEAPEITTDLSEATVEYDFNATATALEIVAVSKDGGDLSYQWYKNGVAITDAMDANYTPLTTTAGTAKYYVIVTNTKDGKTATTQSKTATIVTKAQSTDVSVTGVALDNTAIELNIGTTATLTATISPENATNKNVTWSSNEEAVATVSSNGVVEALSVGTAIITVTTEDGNKTATSTVTVLEEGALAAPVITTDPANTTDIAYSTSGSSVKVTLSTTSENAKIYYTTNGDTPTADSTEYTGEFTVAQETNKAETYEVKAVAINEDTSSSVATRTISFAAEIVDEVVLSSIAVTTLPSKTEYQIGDTLDITGMIVTGTYSDGSTKVETVTATDVTGFDSSTAGTKTLTVTVDGKTATFTVTVLQEGEVVLSSIAVTTLPSKTEYQIGDTLDITGMIVTGTYSDGSTKVETVTATDVTGFDSSTAGTKTLTVTVNGKTATFTVTVAEVVDKKVTVTFSATGAAGTVEAHVYKNGAEEVITVSPAEIDANLKVVFLAKPDISSVLNTWNNNDTQKEITYTIESMITDTEVTANFIAKDITSIETAITDAKVYQTQLSDGIIVIGVSEETVKEGQKFVLQVESDALTTGIALAEKLIAENDIVKIETIKQIADATAALKSITTEFKNAVKVGTMKPEADTYTVTGSVYDNDTNATISNIDFKLVDSSKVEVATATSDNNGDYTFNTPVAEGSYTITTVGNEDYEETIQDINVTKTNTEFRTFLTKRTPVTKNLKATVAGAVYGNTVAGEVYKPIYSSVSGAVYTDGEAKIQFTVKDGEGFVFEDVKVDGTSTQLPQEGNEASTITELTGATVTILNNSWSVSIPSADLVDVENKYVVVSFTIQKDTDTRITNRMQIFIKLETDTTSK